MAGQSVNFDFTSHGASQLAGDFRKTGDSAVLAAKGARLLSDALEKQRKATDVAAGATLALSKADRILGEAEHVLADGALEAEFALKKQGEAAKKAGEESAGAAGGLGALAGTGGIPGGGMGALIGAGAVLSPMLVTLGFGLAGLGLAAYGVIKPIENAAQKTGGLQKNMHLLNAEQQTVARGILGLGTEFHKFEAVLQPTVFKDLGAGLALAQHGLTNLEPVAKSTGQALAGLLGQVDREFQSKQWQSFFTWMGQQAGPDIRLIGSAIVSLLDSLPSLLKDLQPVSVQLLQFTDDAAKLIDVSSRLSQQLDQVGHKANTSGGWVGFLAGKAKQAIGQMVPGIGAAKGLEGWLGKLGDSAKPAASGLHDTGVQAAASAVHVQTLKEAVTALTTAESKSLDTQLAYSNSLVTSANDAVALRKALKASHDQIGFHTAAERASFGAANTYISDLEQTAKQSWASGHGTDGAIKALSNGLPILEQAKTKSKEYWQEVRTLKQWLDKLTQEKKIQEVINLTGNGAWSFGASSQYLHGLTGQHAAGHAAGYLVPGYGGGDRHPALLEGGEAVVPKHLVPTVAPFLSSHKVPGFASGGLVPHYGGSVAGLKPWGEQNWTATIAAAVQAFVKAGKAQQSSFGGFPGGGSSGPGAAAAQAYAASILGLYGWGRSQMSSLIPLWNQESGWRWNALNSSSGAYGIPQSLPADKMAAAGADWRTNPATQIRWGLGYIRGRYGSPAGAEAHEQAYNWYGNGLDAIFRKPTLIGVGERGPERVQVTPRGRGGGEVRVVLEVRTGHGATPLDRAVVDIIKHYARVSGGGDVQVALGTSG